MVLRSASPCAGRMAGLSIGRPTGRSLAALILLLPPYRLLQWGVRVNVIYKHPSECACLRLEPAAGAHVAAPRRSVSAAHKAARSWSAGGTVLTAPVLNGVKDFLDKISTPGALPGSIPKSIT